MEKITAYTVDEWRDKLKLTSDKALGEHFGVSATSIQHYRNVDVLIAVTQGEFRRVSRLKNG